MGKLDQFEPVVRVSARNALYAFEAILQRIAMNVQIGCRQGHAAVMVDEAAQGFQQICMIFQPANDVGLRRQASLAEAYQKVHIIKIEERSSRLKCHQNIHDGSCLLITNGNVGFFSAD